MTTDPSFWRGRRVFLTGHTGFKGSWLSLWLSEMGAEVTGYALPPPTKPSLYEAARVDGCVRSVTGDVRDAKALRLALREAAPSVVIHMAAQSLVRPSYENPAETFEVNVLGTANLLDAARAAEGVSAVIVVTSDKCYENREWLWAYRENEPLGGHDPYSASKACAEIVAASYRRSFFHDVKAPAVATVRAGNVIGGGDWARDRLVPDLVSAFCVNRAAMIRNPLAVRPWQHVLEPLSGYLMLAERLVSDKAAFSEAWNFGPGEGDSVPVSAVADRMAALWGEGASWAQEPGSHVHEAHLLSLSAAKARARLGYRPRIGLDEALSLTVSWYKAHHQGADMRAATLEQIRGFARKGA